MSSGTGTTPEIVRMRFSLVIEYDARTADYEGADGDPERMAKMDLESVKAGGLTVSVTGSPKS